VDRAAQRHIRGLTEVQAIDGDSVFAGGGFVARRSDDGGRRFKRLAFTPVESSCRESLAAGWFVDQDTGYLVLTDGTGAAHRQQTATRSPSASRCRGPARRTGRRGRSTRCP
jgi:hypothetical protein